MKKRIFGIRIGTALAVAFGIVCALLVWMFSKNEEAAALASFGLLRFV